MELKFSDFTSNPPTDGSYMVEVETHFGCSLPTQYRSFMSVQDGGEGFVGGQYLILWRATELAEFNRECEAAKYAPGLLLFGSNGGGEAFAFDARDNAMRIVMVPFIGMSLKDALQVAESFEEFLLKLAEGALP